MFLQVRYIRHRHDLQYQAAEDMGEAEVVAPAMQQVVAVTVTTTELQAVFKFLVILDVILMAQQVQVMQVKQVQQIVMTRVDRIEHHHQTNQS